MAGAIPAEMWFARLRDRFESLARRRVPPDAVDDVVQDAMRIVFEKGFDPAGGRPVDETPQLAWCFQVLRNTVGNHYQRTRRRAGERNLDDHPVLADGRTPLESLEESDFRRAVDGAIDELAADNPPCGGYLRRLAEGVLPAEIAEEEAVRPTVLYRRLYRCRAKLREILERRGIRA